VKALSFLLGKTGANFVVDVLETGVIIVLVAITHRFQRALVVASEWNALSCSPKSKGNARGEGEVAWKGYDDN